VLLSKVVNTEWLNWTSDFASLPNPELDTSYCALGAGLVLWRTASSVLSACYIF